jgi:hypothetical protein
MSQNDVDANIGITDFLREYHDCEFFTNKTESMFIMNK